MDEQLAGQIKQGQRMVWAAGNFGDVARLTLSVGEEIAERTGVSSADDVLDVACGTGNAGLPAARAGGRVTGLDLVPRLLEQGRSVAEAEDLKVTWIEGDAEQLPFEDASFDVVLSTPVVTAKATLEPQGKWQALSGDLLAFLRDTGEKRDGHTTLAPEYLAVVGGKSSTTSGGASSA